jgi:hypothetical protein
MLNVIMLSVGFYVLFLVMLIVVMLNVVIPSVVAPISASILVQYFSTKNLLADRHLVDTILNNRLLTKGQGQSQMSVGQLVFDQKSCYRVIYFFLQ